MGCFEPGKGAAGTTRDFGRGHEMCLVPWRLFLQPCKGCCRRDASKIPEQFPNSSVTLYYGYSGKKSPIGERRDYSPWTCLAGLAARGSEHDFPVNNWAD